MRVPLGLTIVIHLLRWGMRGFTTFTTVMHENKRSVIDPWSMAFCIATFIFVELAAVYISMLEKEISILENQNERLKKEEADYEQNGKNGQRV